MKKVVISLILALILLPNILGVSFEMNEEFKQGETLIAKISGNFLTPILKENINFYRGHTRVAVNYDLTKIDDIYYLSASLLSKAPNNYSIIIDNVEYMQGATVKTDDIVKNFTVTEGIADFSITPGFIIATDTFEVTLQNLLDAPSTINIKIEKTQEETSQGFFASLFGTTTETQDYSISLKSGEIKRVKFNVNNITASALHTITFSSTNLNYELPVYVYAQNKTTTSNENQITRFDIEPIIMEISMTTNSNKTYIFHFRNTGNTTIKNITLSLSDSLKPYILFSNETIEEVEKNSSYKFYVNVSSLDTEEIINGSIRARIVNETGNTYAYSEILLKIVKDYIPLDNETNESIDEPIILPTSKTCAELEGIICKADEECNGEIVNAKDDKCCMNECTEESNSLGKLIGWVIILCIVGFLVWFFKTKYRGAHKEIDLVEISKGKR